MRRSIFLIITGLLACNNLIAQVDHQALQYQYEPFERNLSKDFAYGEYDRKALNIKSYDREPSAHGLVLKEYGMAWISSNGNNTTLNFDYHVKTKIFDSKAFDKGLIELPIYIKDNGTYEEIKPASIQAVTYYTDESGAMHSSTLDQDSITTVQLNKHWSAIRFKLPHLKPGCIIEYKYHLSSPFLDKFKTWEFQSDIPKLSSEYEVHIPDVFGYNVTLRGSLKLNKDSVGVEKNCFTSTSLNSDCNITDYEMLNVPAFKHEPFISSPKNFMSALYFQITKATHLSNFVNLNQASEQDVATDWDNVDKLLKYDENFGDQITKKSLFKDKLPGIISGNADTLEKAKAIYEYIQKTINYNGLNSIYTEDAIKKAIDKHTGNAADVNIALVNALNSAGIFTNAVICSTRDNGIVIKEYPALAQFNYVVAITSIHGKTYLLDATDPLLPFGMLPERAMNDQGRVMQLTEPSYWINIRTAERKTNTYVLNLDAAANGKLTGSITHTSLSYASFEKRKEIKSYKSLSDYTQSLAKQVPGLILSKSEINNIDSTAMPVTENYKAELTASSAGEQFEFNPFIIDKLSVSPFSSDTRSYPVDFAMPCAKSYNITINLPEGYTLGNLPQSTSFSLDNNGGELITNASVNGNTVTYTIEYHLDKAIYSQAEYTSLKQLFDKVVLAENTKLVIKRK